MANPTGLINTLQSWYVSFLR